MRCGKGLIAQTIEPGRGALPNSAVAKAGWVPSPGRGLSRRNHSSRAPMQWYPGSGLRGSLLHPYLPPSALSGPSLSIGEVMHKVKDLLGALGQERDRLMGCWGAPWGSPLLMVPLRE